MRSWEIVYIYIYIYICISIPTYLCTYVYKYIYIYISQSYCVIAITNSMPVSTALAYVMLTVVCTMDCWLGRELVGAHETT